MGRTRNKQLPQRGKGGATMERLVRSVFGGRLSVIRGFTNYRRLMANNRLLITLLTVVFIIGCAFSE